MSSGPGPTFYAAGGRIEWVSTIDEQSCETWVKLANVDLIGHAPLPGGDAGSGAKCVFVQALGARFWVQGCTGDIRGDLHRFEVALLKASSTDQD